LRYFNQTRFQSVLLALWVGGIWTIGYLVAPVLFTTLPDRSVAALVAGRLFSDSAIIGLYLGSLLMLLVLLGGQPLRQFWWVLPLYVLAELVGRFTAMPGVILALVYLGSFVAIIGLQRHAGVHRKWQFWALLLMLASTAVAYFYFTPAIDAMRQSGEAARASAHFKMLHGAASILYLVTSLAGLALVAAGLPGRSISQSRN
jgi:hypothetical protein